MGLDLGMNIANPSKALIALVALIGMIVLMAIDGIDRAAGTNVIVAIVFYSIGNGVGAKTNTPVEPIIGRKKDKE
tara:strand:- start:638 stop:862 length:225 start_codon:yes stop_codon:yes gene_type:complete